MRLGKHLVHGSEQVIIEEIVGRRLGKLLACSVPKVDVQRP
jgi:hypothetical protein